MTARSFVQTSLRRLAAFALAAVALSASATAIDIGGRDPVRELPGDDLDRVVDGGLGGIIDRGVSSVDLLDLPNAEDILESAADAIAGDEIDVALLGDKSFMVTSCLGIKASAGTFTLRFTRPSLRIDSTGAHFEFVINRIELSAIDLKMKPRAPTFSNPDICDWSGAFEVGGEVTDIRVAAQFTPKVSLIDCRLAGLYQFDVDFSIGGLNLKPLQNNLDNVAKDMVEYAVDFALGELLPDRIRAAIDDALTTCPSLWDLYRAYMAVMGSGVALHSLPEVYVEELQPRFPNVDLRGVRFGYSSSQPAGNATTDCNVVYFNDAGFVTRLRRAELSLSEEWDWLLHELRHTEQCAEIGGRQNYAERWFRELGLAFLVTNLARPAEIFDELHDAMPMEDDADARARGIVVVSGSVTDAASGQDIAGAEVLAFAIGAAPSGEPAARSRVRANAVAFAWGSGYELFLRSGSYDVYVRRPGAAAAVLVEAAYIVAADSDGDSSTDVETLQLTVTAASAAGTSVPFRRGDSNGAAGVDISDASFTLNWLFAGGAAPACEKAADVNDDGKVDISDPLALLGFLFLGGPPPRAPYPSPGLDPTPDGLSCVDSSELD
jgi:hypothetical protein